MSFSVSQNDVLEGIKDKAQTMWQSASRSRTLKRQDVSPHQICTGTLFQVGQMLGLDQQVLEVQLSDPDLPSGTSEGALQQRFSQMVVQLTKLHNEMAHLQLPRLDELGLSLGQCLHRTFHVYARKQLGQGRYQYDVDNPRINDAQVFKMFQDAGILEPRGRLPTANLHVVTAAHKPPGSNAMRADFKTFMRLLASVASEVEMDVFIPVAALGLLTRPRPVLKTLLLNVDLNRHWNLPSSSVALDDATLSRLHNLSWEADTGPDVMVDQMPRQVHNDYERVPAGFMAQVLGRLDDLQAQVSMLSDSNRQQAEALAEQALNQAAGSVTTDEYERLKGLMEDKNRQDQERNKLWRVQMESQTLDLRTVQTQVANLEQRLRALEETCEDHRDSTETALGNVQERLSAIVRKIDTLTQNKMDMTLFTELQATLATLERAKVSSESRLSQIETTVQMLKIAAASEPQASTGSGRQTVPRQPSASSVAKQTQPAGASATATPTTLELAAPVKRLAEQLAILQAEQTGAQALAAENMREVKALIEASKTEVTDRHTALEDTISMLRQQVSTLQSALNEQLGEGGHIHNATVRLKAELEHQEAKHAATELAFQHVMGRLERMRMNGQGTMEEDDTEDGPAVQRTKSILQALAEESYAERDDSEGQGSEGDGEEGSDQEGSDVNSLEDGGEPRLEPDDEELNLIKMTGITFKQLRRQQAQAELDAERRLKEQLPPGSPWHDSDWESDTEEEESKYIALAPVQRSRKVLPKPQPPPQPAEEDSSDASDSPTENESAPALRQRSSTIGPRAEGADAGEGVSDGEQEDTVRDQRKPVLDKSDPTVQKTLQRVMNDFARQIGVDIKLDQLTPAELAAAERMALRIMGQKAPEAIAARGRKARLEAQNPNLPLEEANDAITRAKDAGRELVEVVLTTEDASEAMAGARLAVGVLGTEDTIAQTAVAGTLAHGAKNKGDHGHATHTYRPGSGGVGEGDGEGGEGDQGGIGEHENEGEDTDNASGQGLPAAGPRPGRLPPLTVQTPPLRPKSAHPAGLERPTSAAPRAKSAHPAGFEPPTSGQQRTRPKSAHPGSVPQDADGGDVEEYPADFERYSVPCTPHEGPQSTAEPGWEGKVGSRVGSARDEYGGSDTQGDGSPRIGVGRPRSPGDERPIHEESPLERAAADARHAMLTYGPGTPEAETALEALAQLVQQAADESGGVLPQAIQRIAQMALAGYPEDSEAAKRSADQLAKHIFAERCNRARAAEIKDMFALIYGDNTPEALTAAVMSRLPDTLLQAQDTEALVAHMPAIEKHYGKDAPETACVEAQVAVMSHGADSPVANAAVRRAMRISFSAAASRNGSPALTRITSLAYQRSPTRPLTAHPAAIAAAAAMAPKADEAAAAAAGGYEPVDSVDAGKALRSSLSVKSTRSVRSVRSDKNNNQRSMSNVSFAVNGGEPAQGGKSPASQEDGGEETEDLAPMRPTNAMKLNKCRSNRRFSIAEDGLATIKPEIIVRLPADVAPMAHVVNALVDSVREARNDMKHASSATRAATVHSLTMAIQDQQMANQQQAAKVALLEAAVLKVAKQLDVLMKEVQNTQDSRPAYPTHSQAYGGSGGYNRYNRFGGPPMNTPYAPGSSTFDPYGPLRHEPFAAPGRHDPYAGQGRYDSYGAAQAGRQDPYGGPPRSHTPEYLGAGAAGGASGRFAAAEARLAADAGGGSVRRMSVSGTGAVDPRFGSGALSQEGPPASQGGPRMPLTVDTSASLNSSGGALTSVSSPRPVTLRHSAAGLPQGEFQPQPPPDRPSAQFARGIESVELDWGMPGDEGRPRGSANGARLQGVPTAWNDGGARTSSNPGLDVRMSTTGLDPPSGAGLQWSPSARRRLSMTASPRVSAAGALPTGPAAGWQQAPDEPTAGRLQQAPSVANSASRAAGAGTVPGAAKSSASPFLRTETQARASGGQRPGSSLPAPAAAQGPVQPSVTHAPAIYGASAGTPSGGQQAAGKPVNRYSATERMRKLGEKL